MNFINNHSLKLILSSQFKKLYRLFILKYKYESKVEINYIDLLKYKVYYSIITQDKYDYSRISYSKEQINQKISETNEWMYKR